MTTSFKGRGVLSKCCLTVPSLKNLTNEKYIYFDTYFSNLATARPEDNDSEEGCIFLPPFGIIEFLLKTLNMVWNVGEKAF